MNIPAFKPSLGVKFVILMITILSMTLGLNTYYAYQSQTEILRAHLTEKGHILGRFVSLISPEYIAGHELSVLEGFMREISQEQDMVYGVVRDQRGRRLTAYMNRDNALIASLWPLGVNDAEAIEQTLGKLQHKREIISLEFPIMAGKMNFGQLQLGVSQERLVVLAQQAFINQLFINLAIILILAVLIYIVFRVGALQPIRALSAGFSRVAQGQLTQAVVVKTTDEMGRLATSFNDMMNNLRDSQEARQAAFDKMQEMNYTLEERVHTRTKELTRSETRFRAIINSVGEGILTLNSRGQIESYNPTAERIFDREGAAMLGLHWSALVLKQGVPARTEQDDYDDEGGDSPFDEATLIDAPIELQGLRGEDGRAFPIEVVVTPMAVDGQRYRVCIVRDITVRKEAQTRLADVRRQLLDAAHKAGMADLATGVLHNIGNILNSVRLSAEMIAAQVRESRITGLHKANALLVEHGHDLGSFLTADDKGKKLPLYYLKIGEVLQDEFTRIGREAEVLNQKTAMMRDVISTQQSYARVGTVAEDVDIAKLVEDALAIQSVSLEKWGIIVQKQFALTPHCRIQRSKLIHVITNLIKNAKEAMEQNDLQNKPKNLIIETGSLETGMVWITVTDNGVGIDAEYLEQIFTHGFTTKANGHGFGLHSSAIAMIEMGGKLTASSEGVNRGATFTLTVAMAHTGTVTSHHVATAPRETGNG